MVAFTCTVLMIVVSPSWQISAISSLTIAFVVYPILAVLEKEKWFANLFVQKSKGEIKRSLLKLFVMCAVLTAVAWGFFDEEIIGAAAILMWGTGDAAAALIGIPFGKHKVRLPLADGKKSWEGSLAMFVVSAVCGLLVLHFFADLPLMSILFGTILAALLGSATELFSSSEWDTVTVPLVILAILLITM